MSLSIGDAAPDFILQGVVPGQGVGPGTGDRSYTLSEFRGKPVILVFYPGDDTPVCTKQLNSYNDDLSQFADLGAQVLALSAQDLDSHAKFATKHGFKFPLLSDTSKEVAGLYGTLGPLGFPRRSVFVVDEAGVIRYAHRAIAGLTFRPVAELVAVLKKL